MHDIVDTAVEAGGFSTLVAAVQKAGLVETLKGDGPFTVFAPTDEAFAKLPEGTLESLTVEDLTNILTYHVVPAKVMKETAVTLSEAPTVNGKAAPIELKDGDAYIAGAKIVATDIECTNGVIHVVDTVMMP
ncbi:MAG: fasciclin domain-containing protein [Planctomycetota bacterium]